MQHLGPKSLDILWEAIDIGVRYDRRVSSCDLCAVGKNEQLAHPKKSVYDFDNTFGLVFSDLLGSPSWMILVRAKIQRSMHQVESDISARQRRACYHVVNIFACAGDSSGSISSTALLAPDMRAPRGNMLGGGIRPVG